MNISNAYDWLELGHFNQWRVNCLDSSKPEKVGEYVEKPEIIEDALLKFSDVCSKLKAGAYVINAYVGNGKQASQSSFKFDILNYQQSQPSKNMNETFNYSELLEKARTLALNEFREEQYKKDVELRLLALESDIKDLKKVIKDLTDDDVDNDGDALAKLSNVGDKLPGLISGFSNLKSILTK
jgi:hypothetical protein